MNVGGCLAKDPQQFLDACWSTDSVYWQSDVSLEVFESPKGVRAEYSIDPSGVETEGAETGLQFRYILTAHHRSSDIEEAVTQAVAGLK